MYRYVHIQRGIFESLKSIQQLESRLVAKSRKIVSFSKDPTYFLSDTRYQCWESVVDSRLTLFTCYRHKLELGLILQNTSQKNGYTKGFSMNQTIGLLMNKKSWDSLMQLLR